MSDEDMIWTVIILAAAYWWFKVRGKTQGGRLRGNRTTGRGGTVGGGASKVPATRHNTNPLTNAQQGQGYRPAPIASIGNLNRPGAAPPGGARRVRGIASSTTSGSAGSFISPSWPTRRVTSTGSQRIGSGQVIVPNYSVVPLSIQGPGGGGSWLH